MTDVYILTFNCARELVVPETLASSFFDALPQAGIVPDVIAVSLQEVAPIAYSFIGGSYLKPYFDRVRTAVQLAVDLHSHGSERLEHIATRSLGMTALLLFAKPSFAERIRWIQAAGAGVGLYNMGNKGAVAMKIGVAHANSADTFKLVFTAAHLAPAEANVQARNQDWENIIRNSVFLNDEDSAYSSSEEASLPSTQPSPEEGAGLFTPDSYLFVAGDLNYRTHDRAPDPKAYKHYPQPVDSVASAQHFSHFLKTDQLTREKEANRTLHGLSELPITFPPTYKYSNIKYDSSHRRSSSDDDIHYAWAKHRYPSWCDRILFLQSQNVEVKPQKYTALPVQPTSDHRPVALSVRLTDKLPSRDIVEEQNASPFPLNSKWKARRDAARRCEIVVGLASYLTLTKEGNAVLVAITGLAFATWYLTVWLQD